MSNEDYHFVYAVDIKDIEATGTCLSLSVKKNPIVLFSYNSKVSLTLTLMQNESICSLE